jgi:iron complex transport system substrate-binding protein
MRVVSLLPAATEIVAALGALEHLVGVTHECDHPSVVRSRARVTRSDVAVGAAPGAVNAQVADLAASGAPLFTLDESRIAALHPDLVLTQALCDVCAVSEDDVRAVVGRLTPSPRVVTLSAGTLDGVLADIRAVADALGLQDEGDELLQGLAARMRQVHETLKAARAPRPRVAVVEWTDPVFPAGHWTPEMIRRAGGVDVLMEPGQHSVAVPLEQVAAADPEIVLVAPCGYDVARAEAEGRAVLADARWGWLAGRQVWAIDANALVSRPGPRLVDGIETFARVFNPALFSPVDPERARRLA